MQRFGYQLARFVLVGFMGWTAVQSGAQNSDSPVPSPPRYFQPPDDTQVPTALVRSVRVLPGQNGPSIEILATRPLTPSITTIYNPLRLVVDLPKSLIASRMRINYRDEQVLGVRVDQFQSDPPITRLVIDLDKQAGASWDAAGNRLMVRLHPGPAAAEGSALATFSQGTVPASTANSPVSGALMLAGSRVASGSSVTAGSDTAILHLPNGGEARVCAGTTLSVTSSQNGHDVMLGMNTGAMEAHSRLGVSSDSILTPDFRILFAGPGDFHYAVSADSRGNTCIRALPGNTASAVVSELMGDGEYQVRPSEQVVFRSGHLTSVDSNIPADCGCPAPSTPVMRAATSGEQRPPDNGVPASGPQPAGASVTPSADLPHGPETASLPASSPHDVHIEVDAPFVFRAADRKAPAAPVLEASNTPLAGPRRENPLQITVLPPASGAARGETLAQNSHKGFFGKLGSLFGKLFR